jgi:hypothetical protein
MTALLISVLLFLPSAASAKDPLGTISGQVLTQDGKPAKGYIVSVIQAPPQGSPRSSDTLQVVSRTKTDEKGRYRLEKISPGQYLVLGGPIERPTYYPGTLAAGEARPIEVKAGATISNIDFTMTVALSQPNSTLSFGPVNGCVFHDGAAPIIFHLQLVIDVDGVPSKIKVTHGGNAKLREAVKKSVAGWHFRPGTENGRPVKVKVTMELTVQCRKDNEGVEP